MTRTFFIGTSATMLLLAATVSASAQSSPVVSTPTVSETAVKPVAGGAAGQMPYVTYAWENTMARLGLGPSDNSVNAAPTRTAAADAH